VGKTPANNLNEVNDMGLLHRRTTDDGRAYAETEAVERAGPSPGVIRALFTLAGVVGAGLLIWIASTFALNSTGEFWVAMGLLAAAGVALPLSQLFGGWTKWGWPTLSPGVFVLAFLPTLIVGGWTLLANQPQGGWQQSRFENWSGDLGIGSLVDVGAFLPLVPLVIGLVFGFTFDTTGPRTRIVRREPGIPDEDVHDYRRPVETTTTGSGPTVAEELRTKDERSDAVPAGVREERVEIRDPERRESP
jgi:hypothetical protein